MPAMLFVMISSKVLTRLENSLFGQLLLVKICVRSLLRAHAMAYCSRDDRIPTVSFSCAEVLLLALTWI